MPIPVGFTKKNKLRRWIKTLVPGDAVDVCSASSLSGIDLSRGAVSAALAEFEMNGLLVKVGRGKYLKPSAESEASQ